MNPSVRTFLLKLWYGEKSLAFTFWLFFIPAYLLIAKTTNGLIVLADAPAIESVLINLFAASLFVLALIVTWRSSRNSKSKIIASITRIVMMLLTVAIVHKIALVTMAYLKY